MYCNKDPVFASENPIVVPYAFEVGAEKEINAARNVSLDKMDEVELSFPVFLTELPLGNITSSYVVSKLNNAGPGSPTSPILPCKPSSPFSPVGPCGPSEPTGPSGPCTCPISVNTLGSRDMLEHTSKRPSTT